MEENKVIISLSEYNRMKKLEYDRMKKLEYLNETIVDYLLSYAEIENRKIKGRL